MAAQTAHSEPWPIWARVLLAVLIVLVVATVIPWIFMGVAMASSCFGMMGGSQMPGAPMMR